MLHCTSYATSSKNVRYRIRCRTSKWQEQVKNVRYRTFFGDIVRCTYDIVKKTYDVVYDIVYDIARTTGKNLYFDVRCRTSDVRYRIRYLIRYMHEQKLFRSLYIFFWPAFFTFWPPKRSFWPDPLSFWPASTFCFPTEPARFGILILTNSAEIQCRNHALTRTGPISEPGVQSRTDGTPGQS